MSWEELLKQLHEESAEENKTEAPASTSKGPRKSEKGIPSCTSAKRKQSEKSIEDKASSSTKETTSAPTEETPST